MAAATVLLLLAACSADTELTTPETGGQELEVELAAMALPQEDETERTATRSWTPPPTYYLYSQLYEGRSYVNYANLAQKAIDIFFTGGTEEDPLHGRLRYVSGTDKWKLALTNDLENLSGGDYYAYGFIPREAADNAAIAKLPGSDTFADGCVLTIQGLQSVAHDACVVIGAKEGPDADHDNGLRAGDFKLHLYTGEDEHNYLYLLFDHLCSALSISMKVDAKYNSLRTIRLKSMRLQSANDDGPTAKKYDVSITLHKTTDGSSPIATDGEHHELITFTPVGTEQSGGTVFASTEGHTLSTTASWFLSHFLPLGVTRLILTCTYDVYDKNTTTAHPEGNLVRKDCQATNTINLADYIAYFSETKRRNHYFVNLTIRPTYLYMMSEPDLNNPQMTVGE